MARAATSFLALGVLLLCLTASSQGSRVLLQGLTSVPTGGNGGTFSSTPGGGASERATSRAGNSTETANTAPARAGLVGGGGGLVTTNLGSSSNFQCITAACARG